jgi:hypothetical protein
MVTGLDFSFKTVRAYSKTTLVHPRFEGDFMYLTAPDMPEIKVSLTSLGQEVTGK